MRPLAALILFSTVLCFAQESPPRDTNNRIVIVIPGRAYPLAVAKNKLAQLLIASLIDEGKGIIDAKREREIRNLMKSIEHWPPETSALDTKGVQIFQ